MEKIYSKIDPTILLHVVVREEDIQPGRKDFIDPQNFLQCSMLNLQKDVTFKPHRHIWKHREQKVIAQESWVVIKGSVKCIFYDCIGDDIVAEVILRAGDSSYTLLGGHNYLILEDETKVLEFKTGPYEGQLQDKKFI